MRELEKAAYIKRKMDKLYLDYIKTDKKLEVNIIYINNAISIEVGCMLNTIPCDNYSGTMSDVEDLQGRYFEQKKIKE